MKEKIQNMQKKKWKGKKKIIIPIVIVALLAIVGIPFFMHGGKKNAASETEQTATTATAEKGSISTSVTGTGSLENGDTVDVTIPVGVKVKKVLVESGDTVKKGQTLCTVDKASVAGELLDVRDSIESLEDEIDDIDGDTSDETSDAYLEYLSLKGELKTLKKTEDTLEDLMDSLKIKATSAGTIASVNVSEDTEVSQSTGSASSDSSTGSSVGASAMSYDEGTKAGFTFLSSETKKYTLSYMDTDDEADESTDVAIDSKDLVLEVTAPETGKEPQISLESSSYYTSTIEWSPSDSVFAADTAYTAKIELTAKDGYCFDSTSVPTVDGAEVTYTIPKASSMTITAVYEKTASNDSESDDSQKQNGTDQKTDTEKKTDPQTNQKTDTTDDTKNNTQTKTTGNTGSTGVSISSSGGSTSASTSTGASESTYDAYNATAFSIASNDEVTVSINVDELDINSVSVGQTAKVTLDAIEDQEFEGTITSVSGTAVSGTSSTKYPVEVTIDKTDEMKIGMSASVVIYMEEVEDAVLIPVSALQEQGNRTFVYTSQDEDGNLTGETEVETGLSNGTQVEITSGLSEGDTVYYMKASSDSSEDMSGFSMSGDMGDMPGGDMPGGGDMQGGGNMKGGGEKPDNGGGSAPSGGPSGGGSSGGKN